jgi:hypothetical protein
LNHAWTIHISGLTNFKKENIMLRGKPLWRKVGIRNGRPLLFSYLIYPGAAAVAAALDTAFPWDEAPEGASFWLTIYDRLMSLATPAPLATAAV